ncbi:beta-glucosidase [Solirubrobacter sp. CPCC 204708]|uniref:Beta-glucosidase n=1 Tax=Solirubrobacter deserti TaxID=2282478 RepID=A0ABT4RJ85_9ACTN|nr:GH1 family beta-glucosidase [Solirubrobacter deserti]MBE2317623.1 beta-glucosidase [Solirubrobacter deserti]MDA0138572.1 GH1 family beta-glucosidase [Solirubrobacter deserti]
MTATAPQPWLAAADGLPAGFRFGAATASYQVEGAAREDGRGESIWDRFSHLPGNVVNGDTGDVACDHYHRWTDDLDLMVSLGLESYRFSIAWPRVQPDGRGPLNARGVAWYRRLVEGLLERGIEPVATLYHWDLPQARQEAGGWAVRDTALRFAEYADSMASVLGDVVEGWITHNEPWVVAFLGHAHGRKAPGIRDWPTALAVSHNLLLSHGLAVDALRARVPDTPVGITLNLNPMRGEPEAAALMDAHQNRWFLDPVLRGTYPAEMIEAYERVFGALPVNPEDLDVISRPIDFLGVNYYNPTYVRASSEAPLGASTYAPRGALTAMGWPVDASGLHELLVRLRADYGDLEIWITENGAAFDDEKLVDGVVEDPSRVAYLSSHLEALRRAAREGVNVKRYHAWSLLDNFEWEHGYDKRFGIVRVDYETQERILKRSALWYRDHIAATRGGGA